VKPLTPADATALRAELGEAYKLCSSPAGFLVIVLDALDQAGAPENVQLNVRYMLRSFDERATDDALQAWIDSDEPGAKEALRDEP
jgi:hypothetical protein